MSERTIIGHEHSPMILGALIESKGLTLHMEYSNGYNFFGGDAFCFGNKREFVTPKRKEADNGR